MSFANSLKKGHYFLNFEDKKQRVIKSTYAKGSLWLPVIGFTNLLCAHFTYMTTGHVPIGEYRQRFSSPPAAHVVKLRSKPVNTSSWNVTCMTPPHNCATSSLTASSTSSWMTLVHLALIMVKVPSWHDSSE